MRLGTVIVTGGNAGIGLETARGLAARDGARVVLAVRNLEAGEEAARDITATTGNAAVEAMRVDLASLADVRRFAAEFRASHDRLDVLVNNAGLHTARRELTVDGYERTFAVNHLAHFLLTRELLPQRPTRMVTAAAPREDQDAHPPMRVVTVASAAHLGGSLAFLDDPNAERGFSGFRAYANSKLANVLFSLELARRHPEVGSFAVHPGSVRTGWARGRESGLFRFGVALASPFLLSPAKGARTSLYAATSPDLDGKTGLYLDREKPATPSAAARDPDAARRLWELSERLVTRNDSGAAPRRS